MLQRLVGVFMGVPRPGGHGDVVVMAAETALVAITLAGLTGCGDDHTGHDHSQHQPVEPATTGGTTDGQVKPYPLDTCLVSGKKLGSMGEPKRIVHDGQEIKFCCGGCEEPFLKDPAKYLKQMAEAQKK